MLRDTLRAQAGTVILFLSLILLIISLLLRLITFQAPFQRVQSSLYMFEDNEAVIRMIIKAHSPL